MNFSTGHIPRLAAYITVQGNQFPLQSSMILPSVTRSGIRGETFLKKIVIR